MRYLSKTDLEQIDSYLNLLQGNINRLCITDDESEYGQRCYFAMRNVSSILRITSKRFNEEGEEK